MEDGSGGNGDNDPETEVPQAPPDSVSQPERHNMELLNILAQYRVIKDALTAGEYLGAWEATLPVQQSMITLGRNLGFKAGPNDDDTRAEIALVAEECCDLAATAKQTHEGVTGQFDWRTALMKILAALFEAWKPNG